MASPHLCVGLPAKKTSPWKQPDASADGAASIDPPAGSGRLINTPPGGGRNAGNKQSFDSSNCTYAVMRGFASRGLAPKSQIGWTAIFVRVTFSEACLNLFSSTQSK